MDIKLLKKWVGRRDLQARLLAGYDGPHSLGVGSSALQSGVPVFVLRVGTSDTSRFARSIMLEGEPVEVVIRPGYVEPSFEF